MKKAIVLIPCYNEEEIITSFIESLQSSLKHISGWQFSIVIINDGSTDKSVEKIMSFNKLNNDGTVEICHTPFNVGHQRALLYGIRKLHNSSAFDKVIIMDGDGEDNPEVIPRLLKFDDYDLVNVKRGSREEGAVFRFLYFLYKKLTKLVLGVEINFGNYCMISPNIVNQLAIEGYLHLPSYLSKLSIKKTAIVANRSGRIGGKSKMNIDSLIIHGLKSLGEYTDKIVLLIFKAVICLFFIFFFMIVFIAYLKLNDLASPGWASNLISSLINSMLICTGFLLLGIIHMRSQETYKNKIDIS